MKPSSPLTYSPAAKLAMAYAQKKVAEMYDDPELAAHAATREREATTELQALAAKEPAEKAP